MDFKKILTYILMVIVSIIAEEYDDSDCQTHSEDCKNTSPQEFSKDNNEYPNKETSDKYLNAEDDHHDDDHDDHDHNPHHEEDHHYHSDLNDYGFGKNTDYYGNPIKSNQMDSQRYRRIKNKGNRKRKPLKYGAEHDDETENESVDDELGEDDDYDSDNGGESHHNGHDRRKGPPRYPPMDRNKLYEQGLLMYMRDFHMDMVI